MRVGSLAALAGTIFLLFGGGLHFGGPSVAPDPHDYYQQARERLKQGDLQAAAALITRLGNLVAEQSDWDPGHVFADRLLPPLMARLKRMQTAARKLDAWSDSAVDGLKPPAITDELSTVRSYTDWATATIKQLRAERDAIVTSALSDPEEQAALTRTPSYLRTERLLQTDVLQKMAQSAGDDILGLLSGDPRIESVLVRFRQLKRDLIQTVAERDRLEGQLGQARQFDDSVLRALAAAVADAQPSLPTGRLQPADVAHLFAASLDRTLEDVKRRPTQTSLERERRRTSLDRDRRCNEVLQAAGIGTDQRARIRAVADAVDATPVDDGILFAATNANSLRAFLLGVLAATAAFSGWLACARNRRRAPGVAAGGSHEVRREPDNDLDPRRWADGRTDVARGTDNPGSNRNSGHGAEGSGSDSGYNVA